MHACPADASQRAWRRQLKRRGVMPWRRPPAAGHALALGAACSDRQSLPNLSYFSPPLLLLDSGGTRPVP